MQPVSITIGCAPRTKKTSNRTVDLGKRCRACHRGPRTIVLPSEAYLRYEAAAAAPLRDAWQRPPISRPVGIAAAFFVDADRVVDAHALYQGLADVLVAAGILADDNRRIVVHWDGSRVYVDHRRPRVELVITEAEGSLVD